ncbi:rRNA methyltransferase 1, mitochondrial isoform X2 [Aplysia californica]|uniref:rRNA methyltransferase 1, mitochondrial isoform X2 n=1 Tax=Aplysia californica TaxID=6500 RepID=A0ABM1VQ22_APLCA|nr:rRNA methyltransferase 1, mitochondrial isoform X2 [Aplysia californica]
MARQKIHGVCLDAEPLKIARWNGQEHFPRTGSDGLKVPLWLMLYNIQDPMNFGAILRSAYFLGVEKVIVPAQNSCRLSPVVSKASAGAMELVDLLCVPERHSLASMCQWWKDQGGKVLGTGSNSVNGHSECLSIHECRIHSPTLIILGNEGSGISDDLVRQCDQMLSISQSSQAGGVESLNVSVAAGIILHWLQYSSGNVT